MSGRRGLSRRGSRGVWVHGDERGRLIEVDGVGVAGKVLAAQILDLTACVGEGYLQALDAPAILLVTHLHLVKTVDNFLNFSIIKSRVGKLGASLLEHIVLRLDVRAEAPHLEAERLLVRLIVADYGAQALGGFSGPVELPPQTGVLLAQGVYLVCRREGSDEA